MKFFPVAAVVLYSFVLASAWAEPLIVPELPSARVRDDGKQMSSAAQVVLADYLDTLAQVQNTEFYVVILKDKPISEASRMADRWQEKWIPTGQGGVFVYSVVDKKYAFTAAPETLHSVGSEKLQKIFTDAVQNPPLRQSFDVVISTPILRLVTAINESQLTVSLDRAERMEAQTARWQIIAGIVAALAVVGWLLCFSKVLQAAGFDGIKSNIPPPGLAYRNPPHRSRRRSRRRHGEDDEKGKPDEPRVKDRY